MWTVMWLAGCSESRLSYSKAVETCASAYWPEEPVEPDASPLWDVQELWRAPLDGGWPSDLIATPLVDTDGDGLVGLGDQLDLVVRTLRLESDEGPPWTELWRVEGATGAATLLHADPGWNESPIAVAEVDAAHAGPEIVILGPDQVSLAGAGGVYATMAIPGLRPPLLSVAVFDLEGDGSPEFAAADGVYSFATGARVWSFPAPIVAPVVAADLDGDGRVELVAAPDGALATIFDATGAPVGTCAHPEAPGAADAPWSFAVGDLDADPELEVVTGTLEGLAVCDRDGTVRATGDVGVRWGALSLAQLDADPEPEIVVGTDDDVLAYDHELNPLGGVVGSGLGHSVVDLDEDGFHEVLSWSESSLEIRRASGTTVAYFQLEYTGGFFSVLHRQGPAAVNLDGDPAAELVVTEYGSGGIVALENAVGGWNVSDADLPWRSVDHHPDAMHADGTVGLVDPTAVANGHAVWNGRPARAPECSKVVTLEVRDVCVESCNGDAALAVYVRNAGVLPVASTVALELWAGGALVASAPLPEVPAETAVPVTFSVPTAALAAPIEVKLAGPTDAGCDVPTARWDEPVCP